MMTSPRVNILSAIWLALLASIVGGDTSSISKISYPMNNSSSVCHQTTYSLLNITYPDIDSVFSIGTKTTASYIECLKQTVNSTALTSCAHFQEDTQLDSSIQVPSGHYSTPQASSSTLPMDDKLSHTTSQITKASMTTGPASSRPESSDKRVLTGRALKVPPLMQKSSMNTLVPLPSGKASPPIEFQTPSTPVLTHDLSVLISQASSTISGSTTPTSEANRPAPATHNALVIGVVVGVTCGLLLAILAAAACCSSRVRQRMWFWRRPKSQMPARDGLPRCDSVATTLTAGNGGISNASSDTVFEAYGARPGQTSATAGGRGGIASGGTRTPETYEMYNLRAGYAAGGYLSAV
ncbi:hypothetical protein N0V93_006320 [Gnomoniopsis smithogilvyi]|uniref:Mid2 domain-containing protein n=1 Tax=Gnomoniopsis smithogilvyi TaxID=1191159 RepID=A0A9W8YP53_9PEZI|nr:hypothetical protein N0V93_006320 [Gnomoniopsis smithogilvyi]